MSDENEKNPIDENNSAASTGDSLEEKKIASRRKSVVGIIVALGAALLAAFGFFSWRIKKLRGGVVGIEPMRTPGEPPDDDEYELMGDVVCESTEEPESGEQGETSDVESTGPEDESSADE